MTCDLTTFLALADLAAEGLFTGSRKTKTGGALGGIVFHGQPIVKVQYVSVRNDQQDAKKLQASSFINCDGKPPLPRSEGA